MRVNVLYFAKIRELVGVEQEVFEVQGRLVELLRAVKGKYEGIGKIVDGILEGNGDTAVAVNQDIVRDYSYELCDGDEVAFIPPISGG